MRQDTQRQVKLRSLLVTVLIIAIVATWLTWWQWDKVKHRICPECPPDSPVTAPAGAEVVPPGASPSAPAVSGERAQRRWEELTGAPALWPEDLVSPKSCEQVDAQLDKLCAAVTARPGQSAAGLCEAIRESSRILAARPPRPSGELMSYGTLLDNVFHLFRVLGRERIGMLRDLIESEPELAEPMAMAQFRWLISRQRCAGPGEQRIGIEPLYDYAVFALQSMGGQAYLRRRTPQVEALAGFYALLIIDQAQAAAHNPYGIDPRPEIRRLRSLVASQPLVFRERYLASIDEIEKQWPGR